VKIADFGVSEMITSQAGMAKTIIGSASSESTYIFDFQYDSKKTHTHREREREREKERINTLLIVIG
jgi:hypothetical protein